MICPECGAEYVAGVTRCYDCDVDLVEPAPEPTSEAAPRDVPKTVPEPPRQVMASPAPQGAKRCPSCRVDFGPSYVSCPYCGAELVEPAPPESPPPELVRVFVHDDRAVVAIVQSVLESAGIHVLSRGGLQIIGPTELLVAAEDAEDARLLLREGFEESGPGGG